MKQQRKKREFRKNLTKIRKVKAKKQNYGRQKIQNKLVEIRAVTTGIMINVNKFISVIKSDDYIFKNAPKCCLKRHPR